MSIPASLHMICGSSYLYENLIHISSVLRTTVLVHLPKCLTWLGQGLNLEPSIWETGK